MGGKDPKNLTIKQQKDWLSCRGARPSGKKPQKDLLVARVENCEKNPQLRERIVDPDLDIVFTKSKLEKMGYNKENIFNIPSTTALNNSQ